MEDRSRKPKKVKRWKMEDRRPKTEAKKKLKDGRWKTEDRRPMNFPD